MSKPTWKEKALALEALGSRVRLDSDGCSNAPDFNFRGCCEAHDYYYRNCESITKVSRSEADKRLRKCIQKKWKLPIMPWIYWGMVRTFGWIPWNKNQKKIDCGELHPYNTPAKPNRTHTSFNPGE